MNRKGFSLIEVNVCCAVLAVLSAIGYPYVGTFKQSQSLREEMRIMYSSMQNAKLSAIKENCEVIFQLKPNGYTVFFDNGGNGGIRGDWEQQPGERKLVDRTFNEGVSLERTTFSKSRTGFNGRVHVKAGRVVLKNTLGTKKQMVLSTVGRLRVENI